MLFYPHRPPQTTQTEALRRQFAQADNLPFSGVLTAEKIQRLLDEEDVHFAEQPGEIFSPLIVLWAFLSQCLSDDKSCLAATLRIAGYLLAAGRERCSLRSGAYCKARAKLPLAFLRKLALEVAWDLEHQVPASWRWRGRRAFLVDGSTLTMPDTPANQEAYPQQAAQKPGLGFPILRIVVVFSLATGAVMAVAWGPYRGKGTGEPSLLRPLLDHFQKGDVLVGDTVFCGYWLIALAQRRGLDVVFHQHQARKTDFRQGERLGRRDHRLTWSDARRPDWLEEQPAALPTLPTQMTMRELEVAVTVPGFRTKKVTLATTLLDATLFPSEALGEVYRARWQAELDLRSLKVQLRMEPLRGQSPAMVHKEIWAHFLAYSLLRLVIAQAAREAGTRPRHLSFNAARQLLVEFRQTLLTASESWLPTLCREVLSMASEWRVGKRPDRVEPRAVKRRPKPHDLLLLPREEARQQLLRT
jgi:hypothetical protein